MTTTTHPIIYSFAICALGAVLEGAFAGSGIRKRLDRVAAWCLLPYLLYLFYASVFGYRTWKLNPPYRSS